MVGRKENTGSVFHAIMPPGKLPSCNTKASLSFASKTFPPLYVAEMVASTHASNGMISMLPASEVQEQSTCPEYSSDWHPFASSTMNEKESPEAMGPELNMFPANGFPLMR